MALQLTLTIVVICAEFYLGETYHDPIDALNWVTLTCSVLFAIINFAVVAFEELVKESFFNYLILAIFTLSGAYTLSTMIKICSLMEILLSTLTTILIVYKQFSQAIYTRSDFANALEIVWVLTFVFNIMFILELLLSENIIIHIFF